MKNNIQNNKIYPYLPKVLEVEIILKLFKGREIEDAVKDFGSIACVNKHYNALCKDEQLLNRRVFFQLSSRSIELILEWSRRVKDLNVLTPSNVIVWSIYQLSIIRGVKGIGLLLADLSLGKEKLDDVRKGYVFLAVSQQDFRLMRSKYPEVKKMSESILWFAKEAKLPQQDEHRLKLYFGHYDQRFLWLNRAALALIVLAFAWLVQYCLRSI